MRVKERNSKFYTEGGLNALEERIKSLIKMAVENHFPINSYLLGFGKLQILNLNECLSRIKELSDLIGYQYMIKESMTKTISGEVTRKIEVTH